MKIRITPKGIWVAERALQLQKEGMEKIEAFDKAINESNENKQS